MSRVELKRNAVSELKFQVDVEGTTVPITDLRLSVITESMIVSYRGSLKNNVATFNIKDAEMVVPVNNEFPLELEIFVGNQRFVPFTGKGVIVEPVSVRAESLEEGHSTRVVAKLGSQALDLKKSGAKFGLFERGVGDASVRHGKESPGKIGQKELVAKIRAGVFEILMDEGR